MTHLLIFTFSPVQGFIATARRTRDLFTGSFILSYLTRELITFLQQNEKAERIIYPVCIEDLDSERDLANCPNRLVAIVKEADVCRDLEEKFRKVWNNLCNKTWEGLKNSSKDRSLLEKVENQFKNHTENYFSCFCWAEKYDGNDNYAEVYDLVERRLGALKSWRPYRGSVDCYTFEVEGKTLYPDGCTMCGERLHLAINWKEKDRIFSEEIARHIRDGEKLCGVCLVKRFAVKFCKDELGLKDDRWHYPSTEEVAGIKFKEKLVKEIEKYPELKEKLRGLSDKLKYTPYRVEVLPIKVNEEQKSYISFDSELLRKEAWDTLFEEDENLKKLKDNIKSIYNELKNKKIEHRNPFFAVLISDGDSIGEWLGKKSGIRRGPLTEDFHSEFSKRLSEYAKEVSQKEQNIPKVVVYAGGDDILALLHPHDVVGYARYCAETFERKLKYLAVEGRKPSVSAGILIAHAKANLQMVLDRARGLERKAKSVKGKGAVCMGIMTRTGLLTDFVAKWEDLELYKRLVEEFKKGEEKEGLSSRVVYELKILADLSNLEIAVSLIKRAFKRHTKREALAKELSELSEGFIKKTRIYWEVDEKDKYPEMERIKKSINNYLNLLHVARTVAVRIKEV